MLTVNQQESDQLWQHLKAHIKGFFIQTFADDLQRIEYKPLFMALLEMPSEHYQNDQQETSR
jgi:hypothetical protein